MGRRDLLFAVVCIAGVLALVARIAPETKARSTSQPASATTREAADPPTERLNPGEAAVVAAVDQRFRQAWEQESLVGAPRADDLAIARRLSLALRGTIPSLAEVRALESAPTAQRLNWWRDQLLAQRRTADYLAERLARPLIGVEDGPFLIFRRRRFVTWLADALAENRPSDAIVRDLIASSGLWTDEPATNFLTAAWLVDERHFDTNRLASRVSRAFLGTRIDCAECHDHPFDRWKQSDFQGLAAFFAQTRQGATGIYDVDAKGKRRTGPGKGASPAANAGAQGVEPRVPFAGELLPKQGAPRARLAAWVTDPRNRPLARVTVNRLWGIVFGRALVEPIDSIPLDVAEDVSAPLDRAVLELLAADFAEQGFNIRRTLRLLTSLEVFRVDSREPAREQRTESAEEPSEVASVAAIASPSWSVFPLTRLRPEQLAYSIAQASSLESIDPESSPLMAFIRAVGRAEFVKRFGDAGEAELTPAVGTIPQHLLLLNGKAVREAVKGVNPINASWRVAALAPDDSHAVEAAYLAVLTRRPTSDEQRHFVARLSGNHGDKRHQVLEDLFWSLINSTEFAWNH
ncbi:MAG: DUF1549 and DUF1553 domain-containing protein [Pirellulales bacterium]|nr:DUF1549 and DUF1553 domain-containing protein [Pirellulales bacterium]